jgi:foldase protein PrsA
VLAVVNKPIRTISALGAVFVALLGLSACGGGGVSSNDVANVDGTGISNAAFKHWVAVAAVSTSSGALSKAKAVAPEPPNYTACIARFKAIAEDELKAKSIKTVPTEAKLKATCEEQYKTLKQEVMSFLLSSQWVIGEAARLGINVSDAEVHKQFLKIKNQQFPRQAEFEKFIGSSGQTVSDLLLRVKLNMLSSKIQAKIAKEKHNVTDAEIQKYYNDNKSRFGSPEKRNVNLILTKTEPEAKAAIAQIKSGQSFATVAKKVSIDPTSKANGGLLSGVVKGQEAVGLDRELFGGNTKVNVLSGPVKTAFGYYVYEVKSITPATQQSLKVATPTIKSQLQATKNQEALSTFVKEFKKRWTGKTDCASGYVVADCKQYKAPKTTSTKT